VNALRRKPTGKARTGENKQVRKQIGKTNRWKLVDVYSILYEEVNYYADEKLVTTRKIVTIQKVVTT
jgi:hypothetical protein